ncbi:MAG: amino acid adenylation domain-containing protein [Cyanobacteriota bacterium]|nr:amino acid adenylation domain-containing protein [Cyanobacteriota bacterium]
MSDLQKRLEKLSPAQRELVLKKLRSQKKDSPVQKEKVPPIAPVSREKPIPLSWNQQRLWFLEQIEGSSSTYNIPAAVELVGELDLAALERSLLEIVRRHEILRTNFALLDGLPVQQIAPELKLNIAVIDLKSDEEVEGLAMAEAQKPFDLATDPLLRVTLLRRSPSSHYLLLTLHHIISDGWSMGVLINELSQLYGAFLSKAPSPLAELPFQYADFAVWQRQWLSGETLETQLSYWKETLSGAPELLELPTDRSRPPLQSFRGSSHKFHLSAELTQKLQTLAEKSGATLFMILFGAFATLLYRYTDREDICIGTPIANRNRAETESLIGFFINTLVLRADLTGTPTFSQLLDRVRERSLEAYDRQDVPFEQIVEALQPERSLSYSPLFQVMFALQNAPMGELELPGVTLKPMSQDSQSAKFDLTVSMWETETGLEGSWEYNSDLFDRETIARAIGHFQTLLAGIVANPDRQLGELPLLTDAEERLFQSWNDTKTNYPAEKTLAELFEDQVEKTPDAIAVSYGGEQLTYEQLNRRANQLGHYLQARGVGPEVLVGLCLDRSPEAIAAMLGIIKAGGAYVPIDPDYPPERIAYILSDAGVPVLISNSTLLGKLPEHEAVLVCLDRDWEAIATFSSDNLPMEVTPTSLAYLIYTSGSTGKPKGVAAIQRAVTRLVFDTNYVEIQQSDCIAQASNISFDAATFEIWGALLRGAKLAGISKEALLSPEQLATQLREEKIAILFVTTALFNQLVSVVPDIFQHLRTLLFGGEAVDPSWVAEALKKGPPQRLLHMYGPTESTTFSTWYLIESVPKDATNLPIGSSISNTTIYVLDKNLQRVPIGVPGELYIGGDGLASGYLNRAELTAERFIENPYESDRLYKTGDLVRYLRDGNIEFKGRIDNQVKVRGFRIELGEIEALLSKHPQVREAAVIVREDRPGNKRLTGYILPYSEPPTSTTLRGFLKERLPEYMVPGAFVVMEAFPLTPNGKVNRAGLPAPEELRDETVGYVAPRTPTEKTLAAIWSEILRVDRVGINDNFFALGGDSIMSISIIAKAERAGLQLTPKQLFQHQTIAELAAVAGTTTAREASQGIVTGSAPLTPIQHWFFQQHLPARHHFNQSVLVSVPPDIDPLLLKAAVAKILSHHDALRARFIDSETGWQQVYSPPEEERIPFQVEDLSAIPVEEQSGRISAIANDIQASLNLAEGPIMRAVLFTKTPPSPSTGGNGDTGTRGHGDNPLSASPCLRVSASSPSPPSPSTGGNGDTGTRGHGDNPLSASPCLRVSASSPSPHTLFLVIHHLAVDGVSWRILLEDLLRAYQQESLPPKTTSFQDWANLLVEYGRSPHLAKELDYWLTQSGTKINSLPVDYPEGKKDNTFGSSRTVSVSLTEAETKSLLQEVPKAYNTQINDVLLTALALSFAKCTGSKSLLVDLEGHGREEIFSDRSSVNLSRTLGWFTTRFPVSLELESVDNLSEALKSIKEQLRGIPNKGIGYGILRYLSPDGTVRQQLAELTQPEISFNYLGQFATPGANKLQSPEMAWGMAQESSGSDRSSLGTRDCLLDVNGLVVAGRLQMDYIYSEKVHKRTTVEGLAKSFSESLKSLIEHCTAPEAGGHTPSDFAAARLDRKQLDSFLAKIKKPKSQKKNDR